MRRRQFLGHLAVLVALVALGVALGVALPGTARAQDDAAKAALAPTGTLRIAIAVGPAPSALYAIKDAVGRYRGVTVTLGAALAQKFGLTPSFVAYRATGEIEAAAASGAWDVSFMPVDEERKQFVDFGNAYHLLQSTYLVAPGSAIATIEAANAPGVRIAGAAGTATFRASSAASPKATHLAFPGVDGAVEAMQGGQVDAIALSRETLTGLLTKLPGARVLDGGFLNSTTAIAVPKGHAAALDYASQFIEEAKASGLVRRALDEIGLTRSEVAPAGMRP